MNITERLAAIEVELDAILRTRDINRPGAQTRGIELKMELERLSVDPSATTEEVAQANAAIDRLLYGLFDILPPGTTLYSVEVRRSIYCTVQVPAKTPEAAVAIVNRQDFPLPELGEWTGMKDWEYAVYDDKGEELFRQED